MCVYLGVNGSYYYSFNFIFYVDVMNQHTNAMNSSKKQTDEKKNLIQQPHGCTEDALSIPHVCLCTDCIMQLYAYWIAYAWIISLI